MSKLLKSSCLIIYLCLVASFSFAQVTPGSPNNFITEWNTQSSTDIVIPTTGAGFNYDVYWVEIGNPVNNGNLLSRTGDATISGLTTNTDYRVEISGAFPRIYINGLPVAARSELRLITQWGTNAWGSMSVAFSNATNLEITASDVPNLSSVTSLNGMFSQCYALTGASGNWNWNTINVTDMSNVFANASAFNGNITNWDVRNVTNMTQMFRSADVFNQPIGSWNVGRVTQMPSMFWAASAFNQPLNSWNVSKVTSIQQMFLNATAFNQPIGGWDVSKVTSSMNYMFQNATNFNQDLSSWDLTGVTNLFGMLSFSGMDCANYSATLVGWEANPLTPNSLTLGADGLEYNTAGQTARSSLIGSKSWTITGDALGSSVAPVFAAFPSPLNICNGSAPPALPSTSDNGFAGVWSPSVINNTVSGSYTFTPSGCNPNYNLNVVIINPPATPTSTSATPTSGCRGFSSTLSGTCATGVIRWYNSAIGTGVGIGSPIAVNGDQTVYARCFESSNPVGCQYSVASTGINLTVISEPAAPTATSASPSGGCLGYSSTLSGTCATGVIRWYNLATGTGAGLGSPLTVNSNQTVYARCFESTNPAGCQYSPASAGINLTVSNTPATPTATSASPTSGCVGYSSTLSGTCATGVIRWYNLSTGTGAGLGSPLIVNSNQTIYARCFESSNPVGCQYSVASTGINLTVISEPAAPTATSASPTSGCAGYSSTLSGTCATGVIRWYNLATGTGAGLGSPLTVNSNQTIYARCFESVNPIACQYSTASAGINLTVSTTPSTPTVTSASVTSGCAGYSSTLSGTCGTGVIRWYNSAIGTGVGIGSPIAVNGDQTVYARCFESTNPAACQYSAASAGINLTVSTTPTAPTATSASPTSGCGGYSSTLSGTCATGVIRWYNTAGGTGAGVGSPLTVNSNQTVYARCFETTNPAACQYSTASTGIALTVTTPVLASNTTTTDSICETGTKALTATPAGGVWSVVSGGGSISGATYTAPTVSANTSVTIKYKTLGVGSCPADSANVTFTVDPSFSPTITSSGADLCNGDTRALTGTPTGGVWSIVSGPGSITGSTLTATGPGSIVVQYRIVNSCGNNDTTQTIIVTSSIPVFITSSTSSFCEDLTRNLTGTPTGGTWSVLSGPGTVSGAMLTPTGSGTVSVEYTVASLCGNGTDTVDIVINPTPNASAGVDENICVGDTVTLTATGGGTYQWNPGPAISINQVFPAVTTGYRVDVTSDSGCVVSDTVTVFIQSSGTATAQNDQATVVTGMQETIDVFMNDIGGINSLQILGGPSNGTGVISGGNVIYTSTQGYIGMDTVEYEICDVNCQTVCDTAYLYLIIESDLTIPVGISVNGDGKNDVFNILGLNRYPENHLYIYNRWGSIVFESQPYLNDWNGQSKNGEVVEGTYFYILELGEDLPARKGYIEIKK